MIAASRREAIPGEDSIAAGLRLWWAGSVQPDLKKARSGSPVSDGA